MKTFDIPIVLFMFKRDKILQIIDRIREIQPEKVYLLADHGRNIEEKKQVEELRATVERAIDWKCDLIKNYAEENRGVYENIGEGAIWVLRREKWAIFLEDDNLPELSFFEFCRDMLTRYENDTRILWVCGTNYLGNYEPRDDVSYVFTRHMLPCGWASWGNKFEKFYDGTLSMCDDPTILARIKDVYCNLAVYRQYRDSWMGEYRRFQRNVRPISWDYQMDFSIKANNLFGICPCKNQIKNIGVDEDSIHGGSSFTNIMTKRFCGMDSYPMEFPLKHPTALLIDPVFEERIGKIILYPFLKRMRNALFSLLHKLLRIPEGKGLRSFWRKD